MRVVADLFQTGTNNAGKSARNMRFKTQNTRWKLCDKKNQSLKMELELSKEHSISIPAVREGFGSPYVPPPLVIMRKARFFCPTLISAFRVDFEMISWSC